MQKISISILLFAFMLVFQSWGGIATKYPCYMPAGEPVVDGVIDEKEWGGIPEARGFYRIGSDQFAIEKQTSFKAAWTRDALFLAVRCEESCPDKILSKLKDGENLWEEDGIEFFFVPPSCKTYLQLIVNANGSRWYQPSAESLKLATNWIAKAKVDTNSWSLEMKIPFALLAAVPKDGEQWKVNLARDMLNKPSNERFTCWSPNNTGFNEVSNFGSFFFYNKNITPEKALKAEGTLECNNYWTRNIQSIPTQAGKYKDGINAALQKDSIKNDAIVLQESWLSLVKTAGKQNLTETELRQAVKEYHHLIEQSDLLMNRIDQDRQQTIIAASSLSGQTNAVDGKEVQSPGLVARKDYNLGRDWQPRQIMGRDFWHILGVNQYTHPYKGIFWVGIDGNYRWLRELVDHPLFKESGLHYGVNSITVSNSIKVSISAVNLHDRTPHSPISLDFIETRPNAPFFISLSAIRPVYGLMKNFECDNETYNAWKKAHPNFMGCVNGETDNDFLTHAPWGGYHWPKFKAGLEKTGDKELIDAIVREFPKPQNREELTLQFMKGCEANRKYFFNDADKVSYLRAAYCFDHYFCESGSGVVCLETTNTGNYRHQVSLFFIRGAARQYNKNWMWYIADFYNGYDDTGKYTGNNGPDYGIAKDKITKDADAGGCQGPGCGMSPSLLTRDAFLAYLSGASFVQHEGWIGYMYSTKKDGKPIWDLSSPFGKAWEDWFEFTRKNPDRGASYAPVALLVPFEQGYPNWGGGSWGTFKYERPDWMIDAFMYTIMPHSPVTTNGSEGCLANSPYGDIYDVIVPNTPAKPVSLDVLNNYKVAVMLGRYPKNKALAKRLTEFVKKGGTLLLNIKQVNEFFPSKFLGFERTALPGGTNDMPAVELKCPVRSLSDGKAFALTEGYEMEAVNLKGAAPLLEDAGGNVLACKNSYGKGYVIVSTVDFMVPKTNMTVVDKMGCGKKFPFVEYFLGNIVREVLPLEVKGDIEYGLNKLSDGWLLYLINNKGVTKFTNKEQTLDMSKTESVELSLKIIKAASITELREQKTIQKDDKKNSFTMDIPPGDIRVVKIEN